MVLIDVDRGYGTADEQFVPAARRILDAHQLDWPNVIAEQGFETTKRRFNLDGYSKVLVDWRGIVRAVDLRGEEFEAAVAGVMADWATARARERKERPAGGE